MKHRRWARRAEDRPREICAAALEVFAKRGFAAAKLDDIAKGAGVSKGTLYLYYTDKEELFRAVVRDTVAPNIDAIKLAAAAANLPFEQAARIFLARLAELTTHVPVGAVAKMVIGESRNFPELAKVWHDQVVSPALGLLTNLIEKAQQRGEVRPGDPRLHAFSLVGPILMGVLWRETLEAVASPSRGPLDLTALAAQHSETVLRGILTESAE